MEDLIESWFEVNADGTVDVPTGLGLVVVDRLVEKDALRTAEFRARGHPAADARRVRVTWR